MKDYTLNDEDNSRYITSIEVHKTENKEQTEKGKEESSITVNFADGSFLKNIKLCEENLQKIEELQEKQATEGIKNLPELKSKSGEIRNRGIIRGMAATVVGGLTLVSIPMLQDAPVIVLGGIGTIILGSIIATTCTLKKNNAKVKELEKLAYRNEHKEVLDSFKESPNALNGMGKERTAKLQKRKNPFGIMHIDDYSKKDLELIVSNVSKEKEMPFTYIKKEVKKQN